MGKWHATDILEQDIRNKENNRLKSKMKRNTAGVLAGILLGTAFLGGCSNPVSTILEKPVFKVGKESSQSGRCPGNSDELSEGIQQSVRH